MREYMKMFRERIGSNVNLPRLSKTLCGDFALGDFYHAQIIPIGYEDFNFSLNTSGGRFFVKVFAQSRTRKDCNRIIEIMTLAGKAGVSTPRLHSSGQGYLHVLKIKNITLRICIMDFIEGQDFFTSQTQIKGPEIRFLARQAALINSLNIKPTLIYDSWSISNFEKEMNKNKSFLEKEDAQIILTLFQEFKNIDHQNLPHCFVHGDLIPTNVIKDQIGRLWVVDFSVANYYPRIQELAVLACDMFFVKNSPKKSKAQLQFALEEYQKIIPLTSKELKLLPRYIQFAHAMHVLGATYQKEVKKNNSKENQHFLTIGKAGLRDLTRR